MNWTKLGNYWNRKNGSRAKLTDVQPDIRGLCFQVFFLRSSCISSTRRLNFLATFLLFLHTLQFSCFGESRCARSSDNWDTRSGCIVILVFPCLKSVGGPTLIVHKIDVYYVPHSRHLALFPLSCFLYYLDLFPAYVLSVARLLAKILR